MWVIGSMQAWFATMMTLNRMTSIVRNLFLPYLIFDFQKWPTRHRIWWEPERTVFILGIVMIFPVCWVVFLVSPYGWVHFSSVWPGYVWEVRSKFHEPIRTTDYFLEPKQCNHPQPNTAL